jgi:flagellar motor protein MotB
MSRLARIPWFWACMSLLVAGCANDPMVMKGKIAQLEQQQASTSRQYAQLQDRANALDRDNQEKTAQLGQAVQQSKVSEDQLALLRSQLQTVTSQLAQARTDKENSDRRVQVLNASMQRQGGVTIDPNSSLQQTLPAVNIAGAFVRRDGEVVRIELPGNAMFEPGTARLRPGAVNLITEVATEVARVYPDQMIGIEGYTDNDPVSGGQFRNNHELSVTRAMAVYDVVVSHSRLQGSQLFVTGHGPTQAAYSNATTEGKQRNRRVEFVVYPDRKS